MLKNYFKIAWRNLKRNKSYAFINVAGLSLGIACAILIFTLVTYHFSFDNFHKDKDRIYRVVSNFNNENNGYTPGVPGPMGKAIKNDYSFFDKVARVVVYDDILISLPEEKQVKKFQEEQGAAFADPDFFSIFNFPLIKGDINTALSSPNSTIITEKIAKKYFGSSDAAMGKLIKMENKINFTVKGVLKDLPPNTDRRAEIYLSYYNLKDQNAWTANDSSWGSISSSCQCFVLLKPGVSAKQADDNLKGINKKYLDKRDAEFESFVVQPLSDIHFNTNYDANIDKKYLWALTFIGFFLIITACVNFVNLATAQALNRSKEVGIRKVMGSLRMQLFWQFIVETGLITIFALVIAYSIAYLVLPYLNKLFQTQMSLHLFSNMSLLVFIIITGISVVFLSGSYPGLVLSRFKPVEALKSKLSQKNIGGFSLRRVLVVTQFAISQILIIGTIVIASQMHYSQTADLGFTKNAIVQVPVPSRDKGKMNTLKNEIAKIGDVQKVSLCFEAPASGSNNQSSPYYENNPEYEHWSANLKDADDQYLNTFGLQLIAGRNYYPADTTTEYVVNETFVKKLNLKPQEAIGKMISVNGPRAKRMIVGVVKDFYNSSFRDEIAPIVFKSNANNYRNCVVKVNMKNLPTLLPKLEKIWNEQYPEYVYKYDFLDAEIAKFYETDITMLKLVEIFAGIAVFIGCLGLYGLVAFMAVRKTKEIGVRKVLGASAGSIIWLFGKEFSRLLLIAFIIAAPIAWWSMHKYLEDFKYRINIGIGIFAISIGCTFIIAALTVAYNSLKAAFSNPVKSIRTE